MTGNKLAPSSWQEPRSAGPILVASDNVYRLERHKHAGQRIAKLGAGSRGWRRVNPKMNGAGR